MEIIEITKDTIIADLLRFDMEIAYVLMDAGMHCVSCPASLSETIEEACWVHGIDPEGIVAMVKEFVEDKKADGGYDQVEESTDEKESDTSVNGLADQLNSTYGTFY